MTAFCGRTPTRASDITGAKYVARAFEEIGVGILEQPLPADQFSAMTELRRATRIALAVDEASVSPGDFLNYAWPREWSIILIIKVTRSGGLWPSLQQIAIAQAAGLPMLVSGLTDQALHQAGGMPARQRVRDRRPGGAERLAIHR